MTSIDQNSASNNQDNSDLANNSDFSLKLKHYEIRASLGEGGFGQVYEAWDSKLCRKVAIKRMKNLGNGMDAASLVKEARLAASLQHAAFVKIHAIEDDEDSQSIVMELVPGLTLKEVIQQIAKGAIGNANGNEIGKEVSDAFEREHKALEIILQISEAMQEAHDIKLIHGDLKPSNFIIEPSGKVRILDFGLAIKGDPNATTSVSQQDPEGTIAYMSPELFSGSTANVQSDIYALGTILYELVHGARPFAKLHGLALAAAQVHNSSDQWTYSEKVSTNTVQLIRAMTAHDVKNRCANMQVVSQKIKAILNNDNSGSVKIPLVDLTSIADKNEDIELKKSTLTTTSRMKKSAFAFIALVLTTVIGWQVYPYLPNIQKTLTPFSESNELKKGMQALEHFDRPGSLDAAEMHFNTILENRPNNAAAVAGLSLVYSHRYASDNQDENWLQKANASAQRAIELNDQLALSQIAMAWTLTQQGKNELALATYNTKVFTLDPSNTFAWYGKINVYIKMQKFSEAKDTAFQALKIFPKDRILFDSLGTVYYQMGQYKQAELQFRKSIELEPDAIFSYSNLSGILLYQGQTDEALKVLQQGLQVRPNSFLYTNLGNVFFMKGEYLAAANAFESAVSPTKGNPNNALCWANLADTLLWIPDRKKEAAQAYDKARALLEPKLKQTPNDVTLVSRMGLYSARVGDAKRAVQLIDQAVSLTSKNPTVYFRAGLAYELLGNRKLALTYISKAKSLGYPTQAIDAEPDLIELRRDVSY